MTRREQRRQLLQQRNELLKRASHIIVDTTTRNSQPPSDIVTIGAATGDAWLLSQADVPLGDQFTDPTLVEAAERAGVDDFDLANATPEQLDGALITLRGALGEQWVNNAIDAGVLPTPHDARDVELLGFHEPGADLRFSDPGSTDANVKVGEATSTLTHHVDRYPEVDVVYGSTDLADHAERLGIRVVDHTEASFATDGEPVVVDIGRTAADFDAAIANDMAPPDDGGTTLPIFSAAILTWRTIGRIRRREPLTTALPDTARDIAISGASHAAARLANVAGAADPLTMLTGFATATGIAAVTTVRRNWLHQPSEMALRARLATSVERD